MKFTDPTLPRGRVLIAEDMPDCAEAFAAVLELEGFQVVVARDGAEAVSVARSAKFDAIVLDIGMPVKDGWKAAAEIRELEHHEHTFMAALTGLGMAQDRERSALAGFNAHLLKPLGAIELCAILEKAIVKSRASASTVG